MNSTDRYSLPIPDALVDEIVDRITREVTVRLSQYSSRIEQRAQQPIEPETDRPLPTFLRMSDLVDRIGLSRGNIYKRMSEGTFPASIKLGVRTAAWRREDIEEWEASPGIWQKPAQ